jgi:glycosyltransferase involved in cell wall biosynthesis
MRIAIDANCIFTHNLRGTGKSLIELYQHMTNLDDSLELLLYYRPNDKFDNISTNLPHSRTLPLRIPGYSWDYRWNMWRELRLPLALLADKPDVLHSPAQMSPYVKIVPTVVTIHDIIPLKEKNEDGMNPRQCLQLESNIRRSLVTAKKIITVSNYSKNDILSYFPEAHADKIEVIYWAANNAYSRVKDSHELQRTRQRYNVGDAPYFFMLGGDSPRKNTHRLIEAFTEFGRINDNWHLVVGGLSEKLLTSFEHVYKDENLRRRLHLFGYLPEDDMPALLSAAGAFVFPSTYEGFGLPLLDAMACECPILCSNVSSLPEIAGQAAYYFDPVSTAEITNSMIKFTEEKDVAGRLREFGRKQLKKFNWDKTARQTLSVLREAVNSR